MNALITITVPPEMARSRLDKLLASHLPDISRSRLKQLILSGCVSKEMDTGTAENISTGTKKLSPSLIVHENDIYTVSIPDAIEPIPQGEDIPLDIYYEDSDIIVVNKSPGMVVHPAPGAYTGTLVNAVLHHCRGTLSGIGGVRRPGIVHRIDKDTSGLLVIAKHDKAHTGLGEQFADHSVKRVYTALCRGHPNPAHGRIEGNIARHPTNRKKMAVAENGGKWAATHYKSMEYYNDKSVSLATRIECRLETGRTHQVRVHLAHIGHPLIGDPVYGRPLRGHSQFSTGARTALTMLKRQALHAQILEFIHPISGKLLKFEAELPNDMAMLLNQLKPFSTKV